MSWAYKNAFNKINESNHFFDKIEWIFLFVPSSNNVEELIYVCWIGKNVHNKEYNNF